MNFFNKISILFLAVGMACSCSEDKLDPESILVDLDIEQNELDNYIQNQFTDDYNISIVYKFVEPESDYDYNLSPANYESAVRITRLLHYLGIEPYDRIVGNKDFIRAYFPKLLNYIGSPAYRNNGTMVLGTAEGGVKITLYALNQLTEERSTNVAFLNRYYFHTMHHEFAHILHQNKDYPASFREISGSGYVGDAWNDVYEGDDVAGAAADGFISPYASKEANEDFVETYSYYITLTPEQWEVRISSGSEEGMEIIEEKLDIVRTYFETVWNIDLDVLRDEILRRQEALPEFDQLSLN